ncbi:MAG: SGNH/GDSL hydrolase family protein [Candidatus Aminicenantaceae bacterium]
MRTNSKRGKINQISPKKKFIFSIFTAILIFIVVVIIAELAIRIIHPHPYMYPRWKYSPKYGHILYENCKMIQACPRKYKYVYTINAYNYRGKLVPISNSYSKENIVILGDSCSFGHGVNDGEEYATIMANKLNDNYNIINLSVGGWGLTQQIRRYYEFGRLYSPKIVLLQFSSNDPEDNFKNKVTEIQEGRFKFQDSITTVNRLKKYLSKSIIQKSQIYNLIQSFLYQYFKERIVKKAKSKMLQENINKLEIPLEQKFYNQLLETFAKDLNRTGVKFLMIAINNQLEEYPFIQEMITDLDAEGLLDYYEIIPWFKDISDYGSPEGHPWGKKAHYIVGTKLSEIIRNNY